MVCWTGLGHLSKRRSSLMAALVQPELLGHPVEAARQPLAQRFGAFAALLGDVGPLPALSPQVGQRAFFRRKPFAEFDEQLAPGRMLARTGPARGDFVGD